ncbi:MAG: translation initiation factor IF-3 [Candidatus Nealsonbacteria bacterium RIFCSPLOWO2_01_FULL_43_32]|uniref:Translation initiation factor IF-3 n=1 Tax=Candidatus Nealsonbacteria bacterium RIFCSPLOWO2_01_FULL_43_32 TaxID=1801672 RepID=A0A1G2EFR2_9BACT|nr:MAG: translation initiation factor IF-3 [Candidatus Nealsonbacteria bacterium RIFCSPLOWO2_01_FULL_43_32]
MKRPFINRQIRAKEVRVIDETGKQLGVMSLDEALRQATGRNLDLIQVTEKVEPPVCKLMDYGKYLYQEKKKEKLAIKKQKGGELKGIRLKFNISQHDLETRARQTEKFFKEGNKVRLEMVLRGREKALGNFAKEKVNKFLETLQAIMPYKVERELKREPKGFSMIISKSTNN